MYFGQNLEVSFSSTAVPQKKPRRSGFSAYASRAPKAQLPNFSRIPLDVLCDYIVLHLPMVPYWYCMQRFNRTLRDRLQKALRETKTVDFINARIPRHILASEQDKNYFELEDHARELVYQYLMCAIREHSQTKISARIPAGFKNEAITTLRVPLSIFSDSGRLNAQASRRPLDEIFRVLPNLQSLTIGFCDCGSVWMQFLNGASNLREVIFLRAVVPYKRIDQGASSSYGAFHPFLDNQLFPRMEQIVFVCSTNCRFSLERKKLISNVNAYELQGPVLGGKKYLSISTNTPVGSLTHPAVVFAEERTSQDRREECQVDFETLLFLEKEYNLMRSTWLLLCKDWPWKKQQIHIAAEESDDQGP